MKRTYFSLFLIIICSLQLISPIRGMESNDISELSNLEKLTIIDKKYDKEKSLKLIKECFDFGGPKTDKIKQILEDNNNGAPDPNFYYQEATPLLLAVRRKKSEVVKLLLKYGANPNYRVRHDNTYHDPLWYATKNDSIEIMQTLLDYKADCNSSENDTKMTPLHAACRSAEATELLLKKGAHPNTTTRNKETPLHFLAYGGENSVAQFLLESGANLFCVDDHNQTVLHKAARSCQLPLIQFFLNYAQNRASDKDKPLEFTQKLYRKDQNFRKVATTFMMSLQKLAIKIPKPLIYLMLLRSWTLQDSSLDQLLFGDTNQCIREWVNTIDRGNDTALRLAHEYEVLEFEDEDLQEKNEIIKILESYKVATDD